jgi:predicted nucleotidyltransferase component of viral defense system
MVKNEIKDYGKSNRTKLLNLSRQTKGADYNLILLRFVQERFLYRLSLSAYRENFFLKGGALLFAHERFAARPTRDMDFLGDHISRDKENIKRIMHEICSIECEEDGMTFECGEDEIWLEDITVEKEYNGTRVHMTAHMDTIVQQFSIDVGFGDVIVPQPAQLDYPLLIEGLPAVNVEAYSLETVVAEKFQTMIDRGTINSRMKDFFDVYTILKADKVDEALLKEAVAEVFANRGTEMDADNVVFSDGFAQDGMRQTMWKAYLKKIKYKDELPFTEVMDVVRERLQPMMLGEVEDEA